MRCPMRATKITLQKSHCRTSCKSLCHAQPRDRADSRNLGESALTCWRGRGSTCWRIAFSNSTGPSCNRIGPLLRRHHLACRSSEPHNLFSLKAYNTSTGYWIQRRVRWKKCNPIMDRITSQTTGWQVRPC